MTMNSSGPISLAGTTAGVSIQKELGGTGTSQISLNDAAVRTLAGIASGAITMPSDFWGKGAFKVRQGIFAFGATFATPPVVSQVRNKVSSTGVIASNETGVGTARRGSMGCCYGVDKGIIGYGGATATSTVYNMTNKISETGVFQSDTAGVGTARQEGSAVSYGTNTGVFIGGWNQTTKVNYISSTGVVASDVEVSGLVAAGGSAGGGYGGDKAICGFGQYAAGTTVLISNTGAFVASQAAVGTSRSTLTAVEFGGDKLIFAFGGTGSYSNAPSNITNIVSNTGVVASDVSGVGTARFYLGGVEYGTGIGCIAYGTVAVSVQYTNVRNNVSNTGVISSDIAGVGTLRTGPGTTKFAQ